MSKPNQMFTHRLDARKGWPSVYAVDYVADVSVDETGTILNGAVLSLDAQNQFRLGLAVDAVAIFALQNETDHDVVSDDGGLVGSAEGLPRMSGLVALGAYELETTEFDDGTTYAPNDLLTSPAPGAANAGRLEAGTKYVDTICGVVSEGTVTNENQIDVIRFWPTWLPTT